MAMRTVFKWLALDKLHNAYKMVKGAGGLWKFQIQALRTFDFKFGTLVGVDDYGNRYYENKYYAYLKDRWFVPVENCGWDVDGAQVPAGWRAWLQHTTDTPPNQKPQLQYEWLADHRQNFTGSTIAYTPYSTTRPKIGTWQPSQGQIRIGPIKEFKKIE
ncbi:NADH dehydrogenase (ubiquinone) B17.2 subunit [Brevipalpus obovatus]|uniref:NADH dehydrogenase (ubiquinone) B17.2 subunit n=1 Tax=Brevipalpus obovatus TaxID=246614 RepID=UPI003D9EF5C4